MLYRYWVTFSSNGNSSPLNLGCGVTASSQSEAEAMIRDVIFPLFGERELSSIQKDIDVKTLEADHVLPNIGNPAVRGVWFPAI